MLNIPVVVGSTRTGRRSDRVARFLHGKLRELGLDSTLVDLADYDIPVLDVPFARMDEPPVDLVELGRVLEAADGLLLVTPEYNGAIPGVLKNALDHFYGEYRRKPVGIATVSSGVRGGSDALTQLRLTMLRLGASPISTPFYASRVGESFAADGTPMDGQFVKSAERFLSDLVWHTEAVVARKQLDLEASHV